jgi:hypothetical protein
MDAKKSAINARTSSGYRVSARAVDPTTSAKRTETNFSISSDPTAAGRADPHDGQKRAPLGMSLPQTGHVVIEARIGAPAHATAVRATAPR